MRKININNPDELKKFKLETTGFVSSYGFPYRLDDLTEKGANYTIFCPLRWKSAFSPAKLNKLLREDVDADRITVEYIDFVREEQEVKEEQIYNKEDYRIEISFTKEEDMYWKFYRKGVGAFCTKGERDLVRSACKELLERLNKQK